MSSRAVNRHGAYRQRLRSLLIGLGACVVLVPAATAETETQTVYTAISGPELQALFQNWGLRAELDVDGAGDPKIKSAAGGASFSVIFYGCDEGAPKQCTSLSATAGFDLTNALTAAFINEWNRKERFGRAWIDDEGDPFLDLDINIKGGVSADGLRGFFDRWEQSLGDYLEYIDW